MGEPTLWEALGSVLTNGERPLQTAITGSVTVEFDFGKRLMDLEDRVNTQQEEIRVLQVSGAELQAAHQRSLRIILTLAFLADLPITKLLRACGIEDLPALSRQNPRELHERMERENKKREFVGSVPHVGELEGWAQAAKLAAEWSPSCGQSGAAES